MIYNRLKFIILFLIISSFGMAQMTNSLYFMRGVPQSYQLNPAFQSDCRFFLGIPGVAPLQTGVHNNPFALKDVIYYNADIDSLITFLHPHGDKDAFLDLLKETNFIKTEVSAGLFSLGFRAKKLFFTFDVNERLMAHIIYPDDYLRLPIIGPDSGTYYDFNNFALDFTAFSEFSMGVSRMFGDKLTVGVRGKVLLGQANLNTELFDVTFSASEAQWPLHTNVSINASTPYLTDYFKIAANAPFDLVFGELDSIDIETPSINEIRRMVLNTGNFGLGLDMGIDFRPNNWLRLSASVVDLGRINWKRGVINLKNEADYLFDGIEYSIKDDEDFFQSFADSLENTFNKFSSSKTRYATWLPAKIFAGAAFYVHPKISFGILSRTEFFNNKVREQITFSANLYPIKMLSTTFTYSIIDNYYKNLGLGVALKIWPLSIYVISDTGPSAVMWYNEARYVNLRAGINLMFGCEKAKGRQKEARFDRPLID